MQGTRSLFAGFRCQEINETFSDVTLEWDEQNPRIVCNNCVNRPAWCAHLSYAIPRRLEVPIIWPTDYHLGMQMLIPIFPVTAQFTTVFLNPDGDDTKHIHWKKDLSQDHEPFIDVGFLHPGEGIQVIRQMLVEHMWYAFAMNRTIEPRCEATHHGVEAQDRWEHRTKTDGAFRIPEYWSVFTTDWCIFCTTHDPSADVGDLVPSTESNWGK